MTRLLSSVALAGVLALSMSSAALARDHGRGGDRHGDRGMRHAPVCQLVKHCVVKKRLFKRSRTVCTTQRVCDGHRGGRGHH